MEKVENYGETRELCYGTSRLIGRLQNNVAEMID